MTPSYYVFPGLKMAYLTPEQLDGIKKKNLAFFKSDELITEIRKTVCEYYNVTQEKLEGPRGKGIIPWARQVFCFLCKKYTRFSQQAIADMLNRDHTTIIYAIRTVQDNIDSYEEFKNQVEVIEKRISDKIYINIIGATVKDSLHAGRGG